MKPTTFHAVRAQVNIIAKESGKFVNPELTANGEPRASVGVDALRTLWLNTGTLCNLECENCYIESSPRNDRLQYLTLSDVSGYLQQIEAHSLPVREIGVTGGEPFMNPQIIAILRACLDTGRKVLLLTNAMRPMMKQAQAFVELNHRYPGLLQVRVSVDHYRRELHEEERGPRSWQPMVEGLRWLASQRFNLSVAGRTRWGDSEEELRHGFAQFFAGLGLEVDAADPAELTLFPEMDVTADVPEITTACWSKLGVDPNGLMCASSRMIVRRKGAAQPEVVACTLLPHEPEFSYGSRLVDSLVPVALNHPHCARFCVLGSGSCSA